MRRMENTASLIGKSDNLYNARESYDKSAKGLKKIAHNGFSMIHNGG